MKQAKLTDAEKQANYRERLNARRNEDAGLATAARSVVYWLERAAEQGVTQITLPVAVSKEPRDFHREITAIEIAIATAVVEAKQAKENGTAVASRRNSAARPVSQLQETVKQNGVETATVKSKRSRKA